MHKNKKASLEGKHDQLREFAARVLHEVKIEDDLAIDFLTLEEIEIAKKTWLHHITHHKQFMGISNVQRGKARIAHAVSLVYHKHQNGKTVSSSLEMAGYDAFTGVPASLLDAIQLIAFDRGDGYTSYNRGITALANAKAQIDQIWDEVFNN